MIGALLHFALAAAPSGLAAHGEDLLVREKMEVKVSGFFRVRAWVRQFGSPQDPLVKFAWQEKMIAHVLKLNGCGPFRPDTLGLTEYPSKAGHDVTVYLHDGGHRYPSDAAPELIVKFFQEHAKP